MKIEEWEPKQGEHILVGNTNIIYEERIFVVKYDNRFYCRSVQDDTLYGWQYAKPILSKESVLQPLVEQLKAEAKKLGIEKVNISFE